MERKLNTLFFFQAVVTLCVLIGVSMDLIVTWLLFHPQDFKDRKRPGINIKEF